MSTSVFYTTETVARDAMRYRFLRDNPGLRMGTNVLSWSAPKTDRPVQYALYDQATGKYLTNWQPTYDDAVDAAMKRLKYSAEAQYREVPS